jgi:hypothetical protein
MFEIYVQLSDDNAYLFSEIKIDFTMIASHPIRLNSIMNVTVNRVDYNERCTLLSDIDMINVRCIHQCYIQEIKCE